MSVHAKVLSVLDTSYHSPAFCCTEWFDTWPDIQSLLLIYILFLYLVYLKSLTPVKLSWSWVHLCDPFSDEFRLTYRGTEMKTLLTQTEAIQTGSDGVHAVRMLFWIWVFHAVTQTSWQTAYNLLLKPAWCWSQSAADMDTHMFRKPENILKLQQLKVTASENQTKNNQWDILSRSFCNVTRFFSIQWCIILCIDVGEVWWWWRWWSLRMMTAAPWTSNTVWGWWILAEPAHSADSSIQITWTWT